MENLKAALSKPGWERDPMPLEANGRQRINEKMDEIISLVNWYNSDIINLDSMIRSLKGLNFIPGLETVLFLQNRPVEINRFLQSLEKSYKPGSKPVIVTSTNFIEAMMAPMPIPRPGIQRIYSRSQIPLAQDGPTEQLYQKTVSRRPSDHGNIISWHHAAPEPARAQSRRYVNRSVIINNGSLQPRLTRKLSERRHFYDEPRECNRQQETEEFNQKLSSERTQERNQEQEACADKSVYRIELDPNYKGTRAPYGTNQDEVESLAKISSGYDLRPPFDTDCTPIPAACPQRSPVMAWQ